MCGRLAKDKLVELSQQDRFESCKPLGVQKKAVYNFASAVAQENEKVLREHGIEIFIENEGGYLYYYNLDEMERISGTIIVDSLSHNFHIVLPRYTSERGDKFTIAHEYGHYLIHSGGGTRDIKANRGESSIVETEANWFAAGFLMPTDLLKNSEDLTIEAIAREFRVSYEAAEYRLKTYNDASGY